MSALIDTLNADQLDRIVRAHLRANRPELRLSDCVVVIVSGSEGVQVQLHRRESDDADRRGPPPDNPTPEPHPWVARASA